MVAIVLACDRLYLVKVARQRHLRTSALLLLSSPAPASTCCLLDSGLVDAVTRWTSAARPIHLFRSSRSPPRSTRRGNGVPAGQALVAW